MKTQKSLPAPASMEGDEATRGRLFAEALAEQVQRFRMAGCGLNVRERRELTTCPEGEDPMAFWNAKVRTIADLPAEAVSWTHLGALADLDPELAARKWDEILEHADESLRLGHRGAAFLESAGTPCDQARFLALRDSFVADWQPGGAVESALVTMLAQAFTLWEHWLAAAVGGAVRARQIAGEHEIGGRQRRALMQTDADLIAQCNDQADRWNRVFLRTLRQLRELRRHSVTITAGQVNIGQQQVNLADVTTAGGRQG